MSWGKCSWSSVCFIMAFSRLLFSDSELCFSDIFSLSDEWLFKDGDYNSMIYLFCLHTYGCILFLVLGWISLPVESLVWSRSITCFDIAQLCQFWDTMSISVRSSLMVPWYVVERVDYFVFRQGSWVKCSVNFGHGSKLNDNYYSN
jgi:hypothetical protein